MSYLRARRALDLALRALHEAYEQARASGYRPGSAEMQALERAERAYRHARRAHGEALRVELTTGPATDRPPDEPADPAVELPTGPGGAPVLGPVDRTIDLSDDERTVDLTAPAEAAGHEPGGRARDEGQRPRCS